MAHGKKSTAQPAPPSAPEEREDSSDNEQEVAMMPRGMKLSAPKLANGTKLTLSSIRAFLNDMDNMFFQYQVKNMPLNIMFIANHSEHKALKDWLVTAMEEHMWDELRVAFTVIRKALPLNFAFTTEQRICHSHQGNND